MKPIDRFDPDPSLKMDIKALLYVPPTTKPAPSAEQLQTSQSLIDDLCDQICNEAHDCGLSATVRITYTAECRSCEKTYEIDIDDINDFDQSVSYCGGSQYCLP